MTKRQNDPGVKAIGKIYRDFQIDTQWSQVIDRGFIWWGDQFAQTIWADPPFEEDGLHISKVHGEIEFMRYHEYSELNLKILAQSMTLASMGGPTIEGENNKISMYCNAFVHEENQFWLVPLFELALILQNYTVVSRVDSIADVLSWTPARSSHPNSGERHEMDDMLNLIERAVIPMGSQSLDRIQPELFHNMASTLSESGLVTTADDDGLTSYVPFGDETALFRANTGEKHPLLGNGLLLTLTLPTGQISESYDINGHLIIVLNNSEKTSSTSGHCLGSWCLTPVGDTGIAPAFVTFIPAYGCNANVFTNMIFSALNRCRWAGEVLFEQN